LDTGQYAAVGVPVLRPRTADAALEAAGPDAGAPVSLGGDIATAGRAPAGCRRIAIAEDSRVDPEAAQDAEVIAIPTGAVATSSITVRRWRAADGTTRHHIIDPGPRAGRGSVAPCDRGRRHLRGCERRVDRRARPGR